MVFVIMTSQSLPVIAPEGRCCSTSTVFNLSEQTSLFAALNALFFEPVGRRGLFLCPQFRVS